MSMKNYSDTIENWTRDLPACRAVPQPTALPRAPRMTGNLHEDQYTFLIIFWSLELLMMSGVPFETCWAFKKLGNNKFYYKAAVPTQPWQRPVTIWAYKPEAANTVWSSWWWAVCRSKHVEPLKNLGIINSITKLQFPLSLDYGRSPYGHINQRLQIKFYAPDNERCAARNMLSLQKTLEL